MIVYGYLWSILYGIGCLLLAYLVYTVGVPKIYTRKLVHILVGFEWAILYHNMGNSFHFLIVCLAFTALLLLSHLKKSMPMISSDGDNSPGTVYYGVSMSVMAAVAMFDTKFLLPFGIAVFVTSFGDGLAGFFGQMIKKYNPRIYKNKSLVGFAVNFVASTLVALAFVKIYNYSLVWWQMLVIGAFAAGVELLCERGLDNIFVPLGVFSVLIFFMHQPHSINYLVPIAATPFVILFVNKSGALTRWATVCAVVLDVAVSAAFGNVGLLLILAFFFGGAASDVFKKKIKEKREKIEKKDAKPRRKKDKSLKKIEPRTVMQVVANGGVPLALSVLYLFSHSNLIIIAFAASVAEALADTWASGFGAFSKTAFDPFKMRKCRPGISGGMSLVGTLSALFGAFLVPLIALPFGVLNARGFLIAGAAAFIGSVIDSALGSLLQVKYKCKKCGAVTEREEHCGEPTARYSGLSFVDNDVVNCVSAALAAGVAILLNMI